MRWLPNLPPLLSSLPQVLISLSVDQSLYDMGYLVCHHWSSRYSFTFYWPISVWDGYQICHHWSSLPQALISLSVDQSLYDMGYLACHHLKAQAILSLSIDQSVYEMGYPICLSSNISRTIWPKMMKLCMRTLHLIWKISTEKIREIDETFWRFFFRNLKKSFCYMILSGSH